MDSHLNLRLQHLDDNIKKDLGLLKEYEDALRLEEEPRRIAKYTKALEHLKESYNRYKQEHDELQKQVTGESTTRVQNVAAHLQQMDDKINLLLTGQGAVYANLQQLRRTLLARYQEGEQRMIAAIAEQLNQTQLITMEAVLDAVESDRVSEVEMRQLLEETQKALFSLQQRGIALSPSQAEVAAEAIKEPGLDIKHRLKVTLPIIPTLVEYESEVELGTGINLRTALERLVAKARGK
ncbi:hypothetical protein F7734_42790 [Scytonema sp. UIC 10036]|uniref:hypothetical protein n=1 Tax=Scytonema sp. UIC 10036 TaxID=2304196 RepID=UPI0012DA8A16|nr:hypothetical protein [Scytonema sp. UIC 10036]MUG98663.1 hypothetical protein [Scytonema sp. UIC 10036]